MSKPHTQLYLVAEGEVSLADPETHFDGRDSVVVLSTGWRAALRAADAYDNNRIGVDTWAYGRGFVSAARLFDEHGEDVVIEGDTIEPYCTICYLIKAGDGRHLQAYSTIVDAVLGAAREDGYGAVYQRDDGGDMRLYSSRRHLGNNPYFPAHDEAFGPSSSLDDDQAARRDLAAKLFASGCIPTRGGYDIAILTYDDAGRLTHVGKQTVVELAEAGETTVDAVRAAYPGASDARLIYHDHETDGSTHTVEDGDVRY